MIFSYEGFLWDPRRVLTYYNFAWVPHIFGGSDPFWPPLISHTGFNHWTSCNASLVKCQVQQAELTVISGWQYVNLRLQQNMMLVVSDSKCMHFRCELREFRGGSERSRRPKTMPIWHIRCAVYTKRRPEPQQNSLFPVVCYCDLFLSCHVRLFSGTVHQCNMRLLYVNGNIAAKGWAWCQDMHNNKCHSGHLLQSCYLIWWYWAPWICQQVVL